MFNSNKNSVYGLNSLFYDIYWKLYYSFGQSVKRVSLTGNTSYKKTKQKLALGQKRTQNNREWQPDGRIELVHCWSTRPAHNCKMYWLYSLRYMKRWETWRHRLVMMRRLVRRKNTPGKKKVSIEQLRLEAQILSHVAPSLTGPDGAESWNFSYLAVKLLLC